MEAFVAPVALHTCWPRLPGQALPEPPCCARTLAGAPEHSGASHAALGFGHVSLRVACSRARCLRCCRACCPSGSGVPGGGPVRCERRRRGLETAQSGGRGEGLLSDVTQAATSATWAAFQGSKAAASPAAVIRGGVGGERHILPPPSWGRLVPLPSALCPDPAPATSGPLGAERAVRCVKSEGRSVFIPMSSPPSAEQLIHGKSMEVSAQL